MKMYRTTSYDIEIQEMEIEKATEKTVWFTNHYGKPDQERRHTDSRQWHETREAAIDFLLQKYLHEKRMYEGNLARVNAKIEEIRAL